MRICKKIQTKFSLKELQISMHNFIINVWEEWSPFKMLWQSTNDAFQLTPEDMQEVEVSTNG